MDATLEDFRKGSWHPKGMDFLPTGLSFEWTPAPGKKLDLEFPAGSIRIYHEGAAIAREADENIHGHFAVDLDSPRIYAVPWSERRRHQTEFIEYGLDLFDLERLAEAMFGRLVRALGKHLRRHRAHLTGSLRFGAVGRESFGGEFLENHYFLYASVEDSKGRRWMAHASKAPHTLFGRVKMQKRPLEPLEPLGETEPAGMPGD